MRSAEKGQVDSYRVRIVGGFTVTHSAHASHMKLYYVANFFEPLKQLMLDQMKIASQMSYRGRAACVNVSNM
jgi:hypothetical protein